MLTEFGSVTSASFKSLQDIATVVTHSQGVRGAQLGWGGGGGEGAVAEYRGQVMLLQVHRASLQSQHTYPVI